MRAAGSGGGRGRRAGKAGAWERALALLGELRSAGARPDVVTYSSLIAACQACGGRWQAALALLDEMEAEGARAPPPAAAAAAPQGPAAAGCAWLAKPRLRLDALRQEALLKSAMVQRGACVCRPCLPGNPGCARRRRRGAERADVHDHHHRAHARGPGAARRQWGR